MYSQLCIKENSLTVTITLFFFQTFLERCNMHISGGGNRQVKYKFKHCSPNDKTKYLIASMVLLFSWIICLNFFLYSVKVQYRKINKTIALNIAKQISAIPRIFSRFIKRNIKRTCENCTGQWTKIYLILHTYNSD